MPQQKVKIELPEGYSAEDRARIAEDIIQFIKDRCEAGVGVRPHGNHFRTYDFPGYTKAYEKFKGSSRVDLVLDDQMLADMRVLSIGRNSVTIGYEAGSDENDKAEGNQTGSYGQPKPNPKKARRFLGMTTEEINAVLAVYEKEREGES